MAFKDRPNNSRNEHKMLSTISSSSVANISSSSSFFVWNKECHRVNRGLTHTHIKREKETPGCSFGIENFCVIHLSCEFIISHRHQHHHLTVMCYKHTCICFKFLQSFSNNIRLIWNTSDFYKNQIRLPLISILI